VPTAAVEEDFDVLEDLGAQFDLEGQERPWMSSFFKVAKNLSATVLSKQSPLLPIAGA
jgi:hypothetical protein